MYMQWTTLLSTLFLATATRSLDIPIVHTNDDGMGALSYRVANAALREMEGVDVFGSAPADDSSGSGESGPDQALGVFSCHTARRWCNGGQLS